MFHSDRSTIHKFLLQVIYVLQLNNNKKSLSSRLEPGCYICCRRNRLTGNRNCPAEATQLEKVSKYHTFRTKENNKHNWRRCDFLFEPVVGISFYDLTLLYMQKVKSYIKSYTSAQNFITIQHLLKWSKYYFEGYFKSFNGFISIYF